MNDDLSARDTITALLRDASDRESGLDRLLPLVYTELRAMARRQLAGERDRQTLDTTALVHEAYLKLVDQTWSSAQSRAYFFGAASRAMRQILIDHARLRMRKKRGGRQAAVELEEHHLVVDELAVELLDLDDALRKLAEIQPRAARVIECRFFGGLSVEETAEVLNVSVRTVKRDWIMARAWIYREMSGAGHFLEPPDVTQVGALLESGDDAWVDSDVGPYRIIRLLGQGGMGVVYLAHDMRLERRVAVKLLPARLATDHRAREQLAAEARAAAGLDHPNIGVVHEIGETGEGQPYIVMAYYEGETLAERLRRERLPAAEATRLIGQVARGLGAAHERGCVHCDIKPSNILVMAPANQSSEGSVVKILDFGIARHLGGEPGIARADAGTAAYLAPERTRGQPPDVRTDLWSMGVVFYEMLTGLLPFRGTADRRLVDAIRDHEPEPVENLRPEIPPALDVIIRKCLRKVADQRYADTGAFLADLERVEQSRWAGSRARRPARPGENAAAESRLAVLTLTNLSADADADYLAVGMTQELVSRLSKLRGLRVIGGTASTRNASADKRIAAIGIELGVSAVLSGSIRKDGDGFWIGVELIDAVTEELIWSGTDDARSGDALDVQRRIAQRVAEALHVEMLGEHQARLARRGTADPKAYEHYLRGRYYVDRFDEPSVVLARTQFQQALDRDPAFAEAWAGLADTYKVFDYLSLIPPREAASRARAAAERALDLDPELAAAHTSLATVLFDYYWECETAGRHFRRAVELDPSYATGHQLYAEYLRDTGLPDDAMAEIRKAQELDPLSPFYQLVEGVILLSLRRAEEAIRLFERLIDTHPGYRAAHLYRGLACFHAGQTDGALESIGEYDPKGEIPDAIAMRGAIAAALGDREEATRALARLEELSGGRYVSPFHKAIIHVGLGHVDPALDLLEQCVAERNWFVRLLRFDPTLDSLRSHPRFQRMLQTVGPPS